jgi:hypothetical protein
MIPGLRDMIGTQIEAKLREREEFEQEKMADFEFYL